MLRSYWHAQRPPGVARGQPQAGVQLRARVRDSGAWRSATPAPGALPTPPPPTRASTRTSSKCAAPRGRRSTWPWTPFCATRSPSVAAATRCSTGPSPRPRPPGYRRLRLRSPVQRRSRRAEPASSGPSTPRSGPRTGTAPRPGGTMMRKRMPARPPSPTLTLRKGMDSLRRWCAPRGPGPDAAALTAGGADVVRRPAEMRGSRDGALLSPGERGQAVRWRSGGCSRPGVCVS